MKCVGTVETLLSKCTFIQVLYGWGFDIKELQKVVASVCDFLVKIYESHQYTQLTYAKL